MEQQCKQNKSEGLLLAVNKSSLIKITNTNIVKQHILKSSKNQMVSTGKLIS